MNEMCTAKALVCVACGRIVDVRGSGKPKIVEGVCLECLEGFVEKHKRR
jgi:hypothetical protein